MSDEPISDREKLLREKQAAGLTRTQAEEVLSRQEAHDADLAKAAGKAAKK